MKQLAGDLYKELEGVLGPENISQEPAVLDGYAWQPIFNLLKETWRPRPAAVALPQTAKEVSEIVKLCNKHKVKFKPHSTGWAAWGGPSEEGELQIDLRRMNKIVELDEKNKFAVVEPYVVWAQLSAEVLKRGLFTTPVQAGSQASVLASTHSSA